MGLMDLILLCKAIVNKHNMWVLIKIVMTVHLDINVNKEPFILQSVLRELKVLIFIERG